MQLDHAALIINRACGPVSDSLSHIVDIDIIAEDLARAAVLQGNRRAGKPDIGRVRQTVADNSGGPLYQLGGFLALCIFDHFDFFGQAVLAAVCLICHDDDVPAL